SGSSDGRLPGSVTVNAAARTSHQSVRTITLKASVTPPPKPHLTISFVSTTPTFKTIGSSQQANFTFRVQNLGTTTAGGFAIKIFLDNVFMNTGGVSVLSGNPSANVVIGF